MEYTYATFSEKTENEPCHLPMRSIGVLDCVFCRTPCEPTHITSYEILSVSHVAAGVSHY